MLLKIASQTSAMNSKYEPEELKLNALFFLFFFFLQMILNYNLIIAVMEEASFLMQADGLPYICVRGIPQRQWAQNVHRW